MCSTAVWKNEKFSHTEKKFREINSLVKRYFHEIFAKKSEREFSQFPQCMYESGLEHTIFSGLGLHTLL